MRRRSSGLDALFTRMLESNMGRLNTISNMWAFVGSRWDKKRLETRFGQMEREGKVLVKRKCTYCPKPPADDFVKVNNHWSVPWTECLKCPLHVMPGRVRFHRCGYKFEDDASAVLEAAADVNEIVVTAANMVNEVMNRGAR